MSDRVKIFLFSFANAKISISPVAFPARSFTLGLLIRRAQVISDENEQASSSVLSSILRMIKCLIVHANIFGRFSGNIATSLERKFVIEVLHFVKPTYNDSG